MTTRTYFDVVWIAEGPSAYHCERWPRMRAWYDGARWCLTDGKVTEHYSSMNLAAWRVRQAVDAAIEAVERQKQGKQPCQT